MEDYIDVLLEHLEHERPNFLGHEYFLQQKREHLASEALTRTLSEEQFSLFLAYEAEHNARAAISADVLARQAFLLAKEIYR